MRRTVALGLALAMLGANATAATSPGAPASAPQAWLATPQFRRFGVADGLPSSAINALVQDRQGVMWFGGAGGLSRYDGAEFKTYIHEAGKPQSLGTNDITQLLAAADGSLWIASGDSGVDRLAVDSGSFEHWRHDPLQPGSLANDTVYALAQGRDGSIWAGTAGGLDQLPAGASHWQHVSYLPVFGGDPNSRDAIVGALLTQADGTLWVGTWSGVLLKRWPDGHWQRIALQAVTDRPNQIWRIEDNYDDLRFDTKFGVFRLAADGVARPVYSATQMAPEYVFASSLGGAHRLWMATLHGVAMADADGTMHRFHSQEMLLGGLPGEWTWRVMHDREGGLWLTFNDGGVAYLAPDWHRFTRYTHIPDVPDSLSDVRASAIADAHDGSLWVGGRSAIDKLDLATGKAQHVLTGLHSEVISLLDDGHALWFLVRGALMRYADGKLDTIDPAQTLIQRPQMIERGDDGTIYVSAEKVGLLRIDPKTLAIMPVPFTPDAEAVDLRPNALAFHKGQLWYANHQGLLRLSLRSQRMEFVPGIDRGQDVETFAFDKGGLWLARGDALEHYRLVGGGAVRDQVVGAAQGWGAPVLSDMLIDANDDLWMFSRTGLWRFDPRHQSLKRFGMQDGLFNGEFIGPHVSLASGGPLYAPTQAGVISFRPEDMREGHESAHPSITALSVGGEHGSRRVDPNARVLELAWTEHELRVDARAFSYIDPSANRYRFNLHGLDQNPVDVGQHGERVFNGLVAGDYLLDISAAGANTPWGAMTRPLRIHVDAPPWERWWAWLLYVAFVAVAVWTSMAVWRRRLSQRHAVQLAEQSRSLAEQANAAKTRFLATLSHELRTPMTGVLGMTELLLATALNAVQHTYAQTIQRSGDILLRLVNDALDLARIESGRMTLEHVPFSPRRLVEEVAELERLPAQAKGLGLVVSIDANLPEWVRGDVYRLRQILFNLVNNALKFTEHGGITLAVQREADGLMFSISDTGPGIPELAQTRLFQPFEQGLGPHRHAGSGLGLAICRELATLMGGSVELKSRVAHGSTFYVRLPMRESAAPSSEVPAVARRVAVTTNGYRVLLVEDDTIVAAVIRGMLETDGHSVSYAANGLAALSMLSIDRFDVMLLDLDLPGLDGLEVARLVRRQQREERLPIIAISARSGSDDAQLVREAGMDDFLRKPLSGAQLAQALAAVMERQLFGEAR